MRSQGKELCALQAASPRILLTASRGNYCYYPHVIDDKSEASTRKYPEITPPPADSSGSERLQDSKAPQLPGLHSTPASCVPAEALPAALLGGWGSRSNLVAAGKGQVSRGYKRISWGSGAYGLEGTHLGGVPLGPFVPQLLRARWEQAASRDSQTTGSRSLKAR